MKALRHDRNCKLHFGKSGAVRSVGGLPGIAIRSSLLEDMQLHIVHIVRVVADETSEREFSDFCQLFQSE